MFGPIAARQQHRFAPITRDAPAGLSVDIACLSIVVIILLSAIGANVATNLLFPALADNVPVIGAAVWVALLATALWRRPDWSILPSASRGSIFLLALVLSASLMPVERLPAASWQSAFTLGLVSSVFDNIPLTALALKQDGYDWGMLAYAVGFGGSMIWFGSSAGVALSNMYPQAKSVGSWVVNGWHVAVAYVVGFAFMLAVSGWHPTPKRAPAEPAVAVSTCDCSR